MWSRAFTIASAASLLLFGAGCPKASAPPRAARVPLPTEWVEARAPNLLVVSSVGEEAARNVLTDLLKYRSILKSMLGPEKAGVAEPGLPINLYVLGTEEELRAFCPDVTRWRLRVGGVFRKSSYSIDLFVIEGSPLELEAGTWPEGSIRHEYHHLYYDRAFPVAPIWFREGMAELARGSHLDGGEMVDPEIDAEFVSLFLKQKAMPLRKMLEAKGASVREGSDGALFYAQAALFADYVTRARPDGAGEIARYLSLIELKGSAGAAAAVWGDLDALEGEFQKHLRSGKVTPERRLPAPPVDPVPSLEFRPMDATRQQLMRLYSNAPSAPVAELQRLLRPIAADEKLMTTPLALEAMAVFSRANGTTASVCQSLAQQGLTSAEGWAKIAESADPDLGLGFRHQIVSCALRVKGGGGLLEPEPIARVIRGMRALAPRFAMATLLEAGLHVRTNPARARELAMKAVEDEPGDSTTLIHAARVLNAANRPADADALVTKAASQAMAEGEMAAANTCTVGVYAGFGKTLEELCETAVAQFPGDPRVLLSRGLQRALAGRRSDAIKDLTAVIESPNVAPGFRTQAQGFLDRIKPLPEGQVPEPRAIGVWADDLFIL